MPTLHELIKKRTVAFMKKNIKAGVDDTSLVRVYRMCGAKGTGSYRCIKQMLADLVDECLIGVKCKMTGTNNSKAINHKEINPTQNVYDVYISLMRGNALCSPSSVHLLTV